MRKFRLVLLAASLLLFPVTLNYMSPVLSLQGAYEGVIAGSMLLFAVLFITAPLLGRLWCGWLCPGGAVQDLVAQVNGKKPRRFISLTKYAIWAIWFGAIVVLLIRSGLSTIRVDPLYMTERVVSVDEPFKFVIYYGVVAVLLIVALLVGRRGSCHTICWMAPFMVWGMLGGAELKVASLHIAHSKEKCTDCGSCKKVCPMSLDPVRSAKAGKPPFGCINCGECVHACPEGALRFKFGVRNPQRG